MFDIKSMLAPIEFGAAFEVNNSIASKLDAAIATDVGTRTVDGISVVRRLTFM